MVGSAHGAAVADDVVSDADTNLSFLHRREQVSHLLPHHWFMSPVFYVCGISYM